MHYMSESSSSQQKLKGEICVLKSTLKVGFHYPSSQAELTARELGCIFLTPVNSGSGNRMPVYTAHVHGRPVSTTRVDGPS